MGLKRTKVSLLTVCFMLYCFASGGIFGLESMVSSAGPGLCVLILVGLIIFWAYPYSFICAELGSAIPEEGGFYTWIKRAMGPFWGFIGGWWMFLSILLDTSVYLVLAVGYIDGVAGPLSPLEKWLISFAIILFCTAINIKGIDAFGFSSSVFSLICFLPAVALIIIGVINWHYSPFTPFMAPNVWGSDGGIAVAMSIGVWFFSGYESIFTMSEELEQPEKLIPKGLLIVVPIICVSYILPIITGLAGVGQWDQWSADQGLSFVQIGTQLGGKVFGGILLFSAIISNVALYNSYLGSNARIPFAMSLDNLFPKFFTKLHPKYGTPYITILLGAAVASLLCLNSFTTVLEADVFLFLATLIFVFISGLIIRIKEPDMPRPFKIPVGTKGFAVLVVILISIALYTMFSSGLEYAEIGFIGLSTGPVLYFIMKYYFGKNNHPKNPIIDS